MLTMTLLNYTADLNVQIWNIYIQVSKELHRVFKRFPPLHETFIFMELSPRLLHERDTLNRRETFIFDSPPKDQRST